MGRAILMNAVFRIARLKIALQTSEGISRTGNSQGNQTGIVLYSVSNGGTAKQSVVQLRLGAQHIPSPVKPRVGLVHQMWASSSSIQLSVNCLFQNPSNLGTSS